MWATSSALEKALSRRLEHLVSGQWMWASSSALEKALSRRYCIECMPAVLSVLLKSNPNFLYITWNVEENKKLHEIFRVVSRFPHYISCSITENRLPLGKCTVESYCRRSSLLFSWGDVIECRTNHLAPRMILIHFLKNNLFGRVVVWCRVNWLIIFFSSHPFRQVTAILFFLIFKSSWCKIVSSFSFVCILLLWGWLHYA